MDKEPIGTIRENVLDELRRKFYRNNVAQKHGIPYDELLVIANPANGKSLKDLKDRLNYTREGTSLYYERWYGPAFVGCETALKRRKVANLVKRDKILQDFERLKIPANLRDLALEAKMRDLKVKFCSYKDCYTISIRTIFINGYKCRPAFLTESSHKMGKQYLHLSTDSKVIKDYQFILASFMDELGKLVTYIIPTHLLRIYQMQNSGQQYFCIPTGKQKNNGRRIWIDWKRLKNNWDLLKMPP